MMEYKVRFYLSKRGGDGSNLGSYEKNHYCGTTLEEAVEKMFNRLEPSRDCAELGLTHLVCTSFLIQRGREEGKSFKWNDYLKSERWISRSTC